MHGVITIPNAVSVLRLLLIPVFVWLVLIEQTAWAGALLGVIGATDWIDGYLARRLDQVSEVGKMLDPIADRLAVVVAVILGLVVGVLPAWFGWGIIIREVVIGVGAIYGWTKGVRRLDVRWLGKTATFFLYFRDHRVLCRRRARLDVAVVGFCGTRPGGSGPLLRGCILLSRRHARGHRNCRWTRSERVTSAAASCQEASRADPG